MTLGAKLVLKTVDAVIDGTVRSLPQSELEATITELKPAPKIHRESCRINWESPVEEIRNLVRGLAPYPAAWTEFEVRGEKLNFRIFETRAIREAHGLTPGQVVTDNKTTLRVAAQDGFIEVLEIQLSGKKRMKTGDFLNGSLSEPATRLPLVVQPKLSSCVICRYLNFGSGGRCRRTAGSGRTGWRKHWSAPCSTYSRTPPPPSRSW
jgi:methionyl-tRNA formyltransferase